MVLCYGSLSKVTHSPNTWTLPMKTRGRVRSQSWKDTRGRDFQRIQPLEQRHGGWKAENTFRTGMPEGVKGNRTGKVSWSHMVKGTEFQIEMPVLSTSLWNFSRQREPGTRCWLLIFSCPPFFWSRTKYYFESGKTLWSIKDVYKIKTEVERSFLCCRGFG